MCRRYGKLVARIYCLLYWCEDPNKHFSPLVSVFYSGNPSETNTQPTHLHIHRDGGQQQPAVDLSNGGGRRFRCVWDLQPLQLDSQHSRQHPVSASAVTADGGEGRRFPASQQADPAHLLDFGAWGLVRPRGSQISNQQHHEPESDV